MSDVHTRCPECGCEAFSHAPECSRGLAEHGISTAQLREKVEALTLAQLSDRVDVKILSDRLDAALKRIENLERDMSDVHPNALSGRHT